MYHALVYTHAAILLIQEIWLVGRLDSKWEDIFSAVKYDLHSKLIKSDQKKFNSSPFL